MILSYSSTLSLQGFGFSFFCNINIADFAGRKLLDGDTISIDRSMATF
jgi:hypothetical protein